MSIINKKLLLILALITFIFIAKCSNQSEQYSMEQIQFEKRLDNIRHQNQFEFTFISDVTTNDLLIDIFFPKINFERFNSYNVKDSILKSLDGFEIILIDLQDNNIILKKEINYIKDGHSKNVFLEGKILSLNLGARLQIKKGSEYSIKLKKFSKDDKILKEVVLVGGLPATVFP
ncbi:MAG: hypothetical protein LC122_14435 [Chitinophagales bacterium]|nr:hypothetical protein [Chitinophagales bacterium]